MHKPCFCKLSAAFGLPLRETKERKNTTPTGQKSLHATRACVRAQQQHEQVASIRITWFAYIHATCDVWRVLSIYTMQELCHARKSILTSWRGRAAGSVRRRTTRTQGTPARTRRRPDRHQAKKKHANTTGQTDNTIKNIGSRRAEREKRSGDRRDIDHAWDEQISIFTKRYVRK